MAYKTGTAQNERDLLDILNKFLTTDPTLIANGQEWTVLLDRTLPATPTTKEIRQIAWKSTGTGIEQDIYICASTYNSINNDIYNIKIAGGTFFNAELVKSDVIDGLVNKSQYMTICADAREFEYGLVASSRCFKLYTRITNTNVTSSGYAGFILPTVPPTEYPYPLCVAGASKYDVRYSETGNRHSSIVNPKQDNLWLFCPDQTWRNFSGRDHSSSGNDNKYQIVHPLNNTHERHYNVLKTLSGINNNYPIFPVELISTAYSVQGLNRWGALDGVYWIPGVQRSIFDMVRIDEQSDGIILNGAYRTTTTDFYVIEYQ